MLAPHYFSVLLGGMGPLFVHLLKILPFSWSRPCYCCFVSKKSCCRVQPAFEIIINSQLENYCLNRHHHLRCGVSILRMRDSHVNAPASADVSTYALRVYVCQLYVISWATGFDLSPILLGSDLTLGTLIYRKALLYTSSSGHRFHAF